MLATACSRRQIETIQIKMESQQLKVPTVETERIVLEPLILDHSTGMFELWSSPKVCKYCPKAIDAEGNPIQLPVVNAEESNKIIEFFIKYQKRNLGFRWAIKLKNSSDFAGSVGFNSLGECSEIAYHLIPKFWGNGLMSEACSASIEWVKEQIQPNEVEAFIVPGHIPSVRLAERLGFSSTGESREGAYRYLINL